MIDIASECLARFNNESEYIESSGPTDPLVSVTVTTYQHANYIKDCLHGILSQETTFPFEIIIGEDGSQDGTREICIKYAEEHPDVIRLFLRNRSTSQLLDSDGQLIKRLNGAWTRLSARGKYIAWCEGDDFWRDSTKLQKQVDFLQRNKAYSISFHDAIIVDEQGKLIGGSKLEKSRNKRNFTAKDLVRGPLLPTMSTVFRNYPNVTTRALGRVKNGDRVIFSLLGEHGKAHYAKDVVPAAYRKHSGGIWSKVDMLTRKKELVNTTEFISKVVKQEFKSAVKNELFAKRLQLAREYLKQGNRQLFLSKYRLAYSSFAFNFTFARCMIKEHLKILYTLFLER